MTSFDLKFDDEMDTKLAEAYLEREEIHGEGYPDSGMYFYDSYQNKISASEYEEEDGTYEDDNENAMKYFHLAQKIKENTNLFCQLEFLIRKIPMDHVKNFDLELIIQKLIYHGIYDEAEYSFETKIVMSDYTPLVSLGCVAQTNATEVVIVSGVQTAVVCRLFVDLCHQVGLNFVKLCFLLDIDDFVLLTRTPEAAPLVYLDSIEVLKNGCVGVVTGKGEVDSAVDTFLFSPKQYPWQVKRIFVQENILERFKKSMEWKANVVKDVNELHKSCSVVYSFDDKLFLCEYAGDSRQLGDVTLIEAYRTAKELMSLLKRLQPFCVSVWSTDVAESNQIAHQVDANIVWINGFGHFSNPKAAQAFFSIIHLESYYLKNQNITANVTKKNPENVRELRRKLEKWCLFSKTFRYEKLLEFLHKYKGVGAPKFGISDSSVDVGSRVCVTVRKPVGVLFKDLFVVDEIPRFLQYVLDGGAIYFRISKDETVLKEVEAYKADLGGEVPLFIEFTTDEILYNVGQLHYSTKAIWTNIGTTFAN